MRAKTVSYHEDLIESLRDPIERAAYINAALEDGDKKVLLKALRNVAEANGGMGRLASRSKLSRESLYRMLSEKGNPELSSIDRVFRALGLVLRVEPQKGHAHAH